MTEKDVTPPLPPPDQSSGGEGLELPFRQSRAVVVGINAYTSGIPPLRTAALDAQRLAEALERDHGYADITTLLAGAEGTSGSTLVTGDAILKAVRAVAARAGEDERFLFYFAGHGLPPDDENRRSGYLIPQNAVRNHTETYLSMDALYAAFLEIPCRHVLILLDCCFAGAFRWARTHETRHFDIAPEVVLYRERYHRFVSDRAWQLITSAWHDQRAMDVLSDIPIGKRGEVEVASRLSSEVHSPFAASLLRALKGEADTRRKEEVQGDGIITATELYLYLDQEIARRMGGAVVQQTVGFWPLEKHDRGQYIFFVPGLDPRRLKLPQARELAVSNNPYMGLQTYDFTREHRDLFYGREDAIRQIQERTSGPHPLVVVVGASGTGKSSLVRAGLLNAMHDKAGWKVLPPVRPGASPCAALTEHLGRYLGIARPAETGAEWNLTAALTSWFDATPGETLLLCIDQFEEVVTQQAPVEEQNRYGILIRDAILAHPTRLRVVLTVRSDFEARFAPRGQEPDGMNASDGFPLAPLWTQGRYEIRPMSSAELREAILGPATERVLYFDPPSLVDELADAVAQSIGALPLLSYTLSELYLRCVERGDDNRRLLRSDYEAMGFLSGSLGNRADALLAALSASDRVILQRILLRLVDLEGPEPVKRRVPLREFLFEDEEETARAKRFIDDLTDTHRLLVQDRMAILYGNRVIEETCVEPAHDALVRGWKQLSEWIAEAQKSDWTPALQRRLSIDAGDWEAGNEREKSESLWHNDPRLPIAEKAFRKCRPDFNRLEALFLGSSIKRRAQARRRRYMIFFSTVITLAGLTIYAQWQRHQADMRAATAQSRQLAQDSLSSRDNAQSHSLLMAAEAYTLQDTTQAKGALLSSLEAEPALHCYLYNGSAEFSTTAWQTQHDDLMAVTTAKGAVQGWNAADRIPFAPLQGQHRNPIFSLAFGSQDRFMAAGDEGGGLSLWDVSTGQETVLSPTDEKAVAGLDKVVSCLAFSASGHLLAAGNAEDRIAVWDITDRPREILLPRKHTNTVFALVFSPDNKTLWSADGDGNVLQWELGLSDKADAAGRTGMVAFNPFQGKPHQAIVNAVAFRDDATGVAFAMSGPNGPISLWDEYKGPLHEVKGSAENAEIDSLAFDPSGNLLAAGYEDGQVTVWDVRQKAQPKKLATLHTDGHALAMRVRFSRNSHWLAAATSTGATVVWDLTRVPGALTPLLKTARLPSVIPRLAEVAAMPSVGPETSRIAAVSSNAQVTLTARNQDSRLALLNMSMHRVTYPPLLAIPTDTTSPSTLSTDPERLKGTALSADGRLVAVGTSKGYLILWDRMTGATFRGQLVTSGAIDALAFSRDGQSLVIDGNFQSTISLFNIQNISHPTESIHQFIRPGGSIYQVLLAPTGHWVAACDFGGTVAIGNLDSRNQEGAPWQAHARCIAFHPVLPLLASGGTDGLIQFWKVPTGQAAGDPLRLHTSQIWSLAFNPAGTLLASGDAEGKIILWDVETRQPIGGPLQGHQEIVTSLAFSEDGKHLTSVSQDGVVLSWTIDPIVWEKEAREMANRPLTESERTLILASVDGRWPLKLKVGLGTILVWAILWFFLVPGERVQQIQQRLRTQRRPLFTGSALLMGLLLLWGGHSPPWYPVSWFSQSGFLEKPLLVLLAASVFVGIPIACSHLQNYFGWRSPFARLFRP